MTSSFVVVVVVVRRRSYRRRRRRLDSTFLLLTPFFLLSTRRFRRRRRRRVASCCGATVADTASRRRRRRRCRRSLLKVIRVCEFLPTHKSKSASCILEEEGGLRLCRRRLSSTTGLSGLDCRRPFHRHSSRRRHGRPPLDAASTIVSLALDVLDIVVQGT